MRRLSHLGIVFALILCVSTISVPVTADTQADKVVSATAPALAIGITACLLSSDTKGVDRAARATDAVVLSIGIARGIKQTTGSGFPSGHTAGAFAMASSLSEIHPKQKWIYYAAASFIAYNTVKSGDHTVVEALGGAALGSTIGRMSMTSRDGLLLTKTFKF